MKISSKLFLDYCLNLNKLADEFLKSHPDKGMSFFSSKPAGYEAAKNIINLTDKILFSAPFQALLLDDEVKFIEGCNTIFQTLRKDSFTISDTKPNKVFIIFYKNFCKAAKELAFAIIGGRLETPKEVNLNYLSYYVDNMIIGLDCPPNYNILKQESLLILSEFSKNNPKNKNFKMLNSFFEMIKFDHLIINRFSKNSKEKLLNLLKYLDIVRLALIDKKETKLVSQVNILLHRALEMKNAHPDMKNFEKILEKKLYKIKTPPRSAQICRQPARL